MKILGILFDLLIGIVYSFILSTVFIIGRDEFLDNWKWHIGFILTIGICFTICKWNKDEIDSLKEEIKNLKKYNNEKTL